MVSFLGFLFHLFLFYWILFYLFIWMKRKICYKAFKIANKLVDEVTDVNQSSALLIYTQNQFWYFFQYQYNALLLLDVCCCCCCFCFAIGKVIKTFQRRNHISNSFSCSNWFYVRNNSDSTLFYFQKIRLNCMWKLYI